MPFDQCNFEFLCVWCACQFAHARQCMYIRTCTHVHTYTHTYTYAHTRTHAHAHEHARARTHIRVRFHASHIYMCAHTHTSMRTYTDTYAHVHTCTQMQPLRHSPLRGLRHPCNWAILQVQELSMLMLRVRALSSERRRWVIIFVCSPPINVLWVSYRCYVDSWRTSSSEIVPTNMGRNSRKAFQLCYCCCCCCCCSFRGSSGLGHA